MTFIVFYQSQVRWKGKAAPIQTVQRQTTEPSPVNPDKTVPSQAQEYSNSGQTDQVNAEPQHKLHCQRPVGQLPLAGKVAQCLQQWQMITSDPWVLQTVQGYHVEWLKKPFQVGPRPTTFRSVEEYRALRSRHSYRNRRW